MSKIPKPICKYRVPLYGSEVWLYADQEIYDLAVYALGEDDANSRCSAGMTTALESENGSRLYLMGIFDNNITNTAIHEIGHICLFIMEQCGFSAHDGNGEPFCYLLGDMTQNLVEGFNKYLKTLDTSKISK